ncbi:MAG: hypothetical protein JWL70_319, partial [Acidimicrobiia bacterium]|nr:hypothetical protein [Acidimicrobiia bacterium]
MNRSNLKRLLSPATIAVVGASEQLGMSNNSVIPMLEAGVNVRLVNPNRPELYGRATAPSLTALGEPIDAVLSLVSAERSIGVIEEAGAMGCGGVVIAAGGFSELGAEGEALQARLVAAAETHGLAIVGPNCSGFKNVPLGANLFTGGRMTLDPGAVAIISQSGFLVRSCLAAGRERQLGFSLAISSGNEAVCGLADYIDVLAEDPQTTVIALVIEKIRDAPAFFAAVAHARSKGKAVLALKLGRTEQSREIMKSHTGAIADESWVYELVLRQAGIATAVDIDELLDMAQLMAQLPRDRWRAVRAVAAVASSGGVAGVTADAASVAGVALAPLSEAEPWVREHIPGDGGLNPLDMTGFVMRDPKLLTELFETYSAAESIDALVLCWWAADGDEGWSKTLLAPFADVARKSNTPMIVSPVEATALGEWTKGFRADGISFCRGLQSTFRALQAMDHVVRTPAGAALGGAEVTPTQPPELIISPAGSIVSFAASMELLQKVGITVAPYVVLPAGREDDPAIAALGERLVVKLADVPHRTELNAVRLNVAPADVAAAVRELRAIAVAHDQPPTVAVQAMVAGHGEALVGLQGHTDLGPVVVFGLGGVLVELTKKVTGRLLPLAQGDATAMVEEVAGAAVRGE